MTELELETVTGPETLDEIQRMLETAWSAGEVSETTRMYMELAVSEIGANIIEHSGGGKPVRLHMSVTLDDDHVSVSFTDDGHPAPVELHGGLPSEFSERGRGLAIAHRVLDELTYRHDEGGNHWTLTRRRGD